MLTTNEIIAEDIHKHLERLRLFPDWEVSAVAGPRSDLLVLTHGAFPIVLSHAGAVLRCLEQCPDDIAEARVAMLLAQFVDHQATQRTLYHWGEYRYA